MSTGFRHADHRYPFLWESAAQPAGRWHADGDGPCQYLADTPDGAFMSTLWRLPSLPLPLENRCLSFSRASRAPGVSP